MEINASLCELIGEPVYSYETKNCVSLFYENERRSVITFDTDIHYCRISQHCGEFVAGIDLETYWNDPVQCARIIAQFINVC